VVKPPTPASPAATRKPLSRVSGKRRAENRVRGKLARALFPEDTRCAVPWCPLLAEDVHETLTRARSGGSITDPDIWAATCRDHNHELTTEPKWGYDLGLLHHSWDNPDRTPAGALRREAAALLLERDPWCVHCGSTRALRPWLRQEQGGHAGCCCGWVMLCPRCRDTATADLTGEMADEGLLIADPDLMPFKVPVVAHIEEDRGGMHLWPLCDGTWSYAPPASPLVVTSGLEAAEFLLSLRSVK
jgi:hypothetical protein